MGSVRDCLVLGGTLVSDSVLEGKTDELAYKELDAVVAQVSASYSCVLVQC